MRFFLAFFLFLPFLRAQTCGPAARLAPVDEITGAIADTDCALTDGARYTEYSLTLPTRGRVELDVAGGAAILRDPQGRRIASGASIRTPAERGPYTVVITSDSGPYQIRSNFVPEPNNICQDFPSLGLNDTASGRLTEASCRMPDGTALRRLSRGALRLRHPDPGRRRRAASSFATRTATPWPPPRTAAWTTWCWATSKYVVLAAGSGQYRSPPPSRPPTARSAAPSPP